MNATEEFERFRKQREQERAKDEAEKITVVSAWLPGHVKGYVIRRGNGNNRAYARQQNGRWIYGKIEDRNLIQTGFDYPTKSAAVEAAKKLLVESDAR